MNASYGMQNHHLGSTKLYVHTIGQPNHILSSKYSDQICHAVIKSHTIKPMKAQKYSNTFQIQEQRGTFNCIDTFNVTRYCNFKLSSTVLEECKSRSLSTRLDMNALLTQFVHT